MAWPRSSFPAWVWLWSLLSVAVCAYDAAFVLLRPLSTSHWFWEQYSQLYPPVDKGYQLSNLHDGTPYAVAIVGAGLNQLLVLVSLLLMTCSRPVQAKLLMFGANCMIVCSTALFFLSDMLCTPPQAALMSSDDDGHGATPQLPSDGVHIWDVLRDPGAGFCHTGHNDAQTWWLSYALPNGIFLLLPLLIVRALWTELGALTYTNYAYKKKA